MLLCLGFASALPLLLVFGSLSFWLREAAVERTSIGLIGLVTLAYSLKFSWAPLVDSLRLPLLHRWLGQRRSWMLLAQVLVIVGLVAMAGFDPQQNLPLLVSAAVVTAFASATQDISIDAYRIECAEADEQAALAATYLTGYRLGMIASGAGTLYLAAWFDPDPSRYAYAGWRAAYLSMAAIMSAGVLTTLVIAEPRFGHRPQEVLRRTFAQWLQVAVVAPFVDFFQRHGRIALVLLLLIGCYRITDIVMGAIANVFYQDMGYSKTEVASVAKVFGVIMTLVGSFVGGGLAKKLGVTRVLLLGAVLVVATNLLFAVLAYRPPSVLLLSGVISADNFSAGVATVGFVAYLSALTNVQFSATQYALFSSLMVLLPKLLAGGSGWLVDQIDYPAFFVATAVLGVPVIALIVWLRRHVGDPQPVTAPSDSGAGSAAL